MGRTQSGEDPDLGGPTVGKTQSWEDPELGGPRVGKTQSRETQCMQFSFEHRALVMKGPQALSPSLGVPWEQAVFPITC